MDASTAATFDTPPPPPRRIWFALVAAPAAWAVQGTVGWLASDFGCVAGLGGEGAWGWQMAISVLALVAGLAALGAAFTAWRAAQWAQPQRAGGWHRSEFLAAAALFVSVMFVFGILAAMLPVLMLPSCELLR